MAIEQTVVSCPISTPIYSDNLASQADLLAALPDASTSRMDTATLIHRLQEVSPVLLDQSKQRVDKGQLYSRVEQFMLEKPMVLQPLLDGLPEISLKPKVLIGSFGNSFEIKGSAVHRFMNAPNKPIDFKGLNDFDVGLHVKSLDIDGLEKRFAQALRHGKRTGSPAELDRLTKQNDKTLVSAYAKSLMAGNGFVKVRFNVKPGSVPMDLVLHQELPAQFDVFQASAVIDVSMETKTAIQLRVLTDKTQKWLHDNKLIVLHGNMDGGLSRIQKWLSKLPQGQFLQRPDVFSALYKQDSSASQARFLVWLLGHAHQNNSTLKALEPVFTAVHEAHEKVEQVSDGEPSALHILLQSLGEFPTEITSDYAKKIAQYSKVFPDCAKELGEFLQKQPEILKKCSPFELLPLVDASSLVKLWSSAALQENPQIPLLLEPLTKACIQHNAPEARDLQVFQARQGTLEAELLANNKWLEAAQAQGSHQLIPRSAIIKRTAVLFDSFLNGFLNERNKDIHGSLQNLESIVQLLQPKDLKLMKSFPGFRLLNAEKQERLNMEAPGFTRFMAYAEIRQAFTDGQFRVDLRQEKSGSAVLSLLRSFQAQAKSLGQSNALYMGRFGESSTGAAWFEVGQGFCQVSESGVYIGGLRVGEEQDPERHGYGVQLSADGTELLAAHFKRGQVKDQSACVVTDAGELHLPLTGTFVEGAGRWLPNQSETLSSLVRNFDQFLEEPTSALNQNKALDRCHVVGEWKGPLAPLLVDPLRFLEAGVVVVKGDNNRSETFHACIRNGSVTGLQISAYREDPSLNLYVQPNQSGGPFDLSVQRVALHRVTGGAGAPPIETTVVDYDASLRRLTGRALCIGVNSTYAGQFDGVAPHGRGVYLEKDTLVGRRVQMEQGRIVDRDLERFAKGDDPLMTEYKALMWSTKKAPLKPFQLPEKGEKSYFSIENEERGRFYGYWDQKQAIGILRPSEADIEAFIGGFQFVAPEVRDFLELSLSSKSSSTWALPYVGHVESTMANEAFRSQMNDQVYAIPHGPITLTNTETRAEYQRVFAFGRLLPQMRLRGSRGDFLVFQQASDPSQYFMFYRNESVYNIRLVGSEFEQDWSAFITQRGAAVGSVTTVDDHYVGGLHGLVSHGRGLRTDIEGTAVHGFFENGDLKSGHISFKNGVTVEANWNGKGVNGRARIQVPFVDKKVMFSVDMQGENCIGESFSEPVSGIVHRLPAGALSDGLKAFGAELSRTERAYLKSC